MPVFLPSFSSATDVLKHTNSRVSRRADIIINARLQPFLELELMPEMDIFSQQNGIKINNTTRKVNLREMMMTRWSSSDENDHEWTMMKQISLLKI